MAAVRYVSVTQRIYTLSDKDPYLAGRQRCHGLPQKLLH